MLQIKPIDFPKAAQFVDSYHRHHKRPTGHKFSIACYDDGRLCGVALAAQRLQRRLTS